MHFRSTVVTSVTHDLCTAFGALLTLLERAFCFSLSVAKMWSSWVLSSLCVLATCLVGTRAAVQADPEMKSIPVRRDTRGFGMSADGATASDALATIAIPRL